MINNEKPKGEKETTCKGWSWEAVQIARAMNQRKDGSSYLLETKNVLEFVMG